MLDEKASKHEILSRLDAYAKRSDAEDTFVFFYAGHGWNVNALFSVGDQIHLQLQTSTYGYLYLVTHSNSWDLIYPSLEQAQLFTPFSDYVVPSEPYTLEKSKAGNISTLSLALSDRPIAKG